MKKLLCEYLDGRDFIHIYREERFSERFECDTGKICYTESKKWKHMTDDIKH